MGFLTKILSATIKTVTTPVAVVADVLSDGETDHTGKNIDGAIEDVSDAVDDLINGDLL